MKSTALSSLVVASLAGALAISAQIFAQDQAAQSQIESQNHRYTLTDLGVVGAPPGQPLHITNNGLISGAAAFNNGPQHAILWYKRQKLDFGTPALGGANSVAFGINVWGQAVGEADTLTPDPYGEDFCGFATLDSQPRNTCLPFIWQNGVMTQLPTLRNANGQKGSNGFANAINVWGVAAGASENATLDPTCPAYDPSIGQNQKLQEKAVIWQYGHVKELPMIQGDVDGIALGISDTGLVAGTSGNCGPLNQQNFLNIAPVHAILWENGKAIDLQNLGGQLNNLAFAVNNRGDVTGSSDLKGDVTLHAFLWTKERGKMQDLVPVDSDVFSAGLGLNDGRQVVGVSGDANNNVRATLWQKGVPVDLNTLIPSTSELYLITACSVNAEGQIIGLAIDDTGEFHGYIVTPRLAALDSSHGRGEEVFGPVHLPEFVREKLRRQFYFRHLAPRSMLP